MSTEPEPPLVHLQDASAVQVGSGNLQVNVWSNRPTARSAYLEAVRRIAPECLFDRPAELARLTDFAVRDDGPDYLWLHAVAWAGKSALTAWFVLNPPHGVRVVAFFITARYAAQNDRMAMLPVVIEQLAEILDEPAPDFLIPQTHEAHFLDLLARAAVRCADNGQRLLLVIDGLDEDRGVVVGPDAHSIAAMLPARVPDGLRVIVSSRPHPTLPTDVPDDHPLRDDRVMWQLAESPFAQVVRVDAERELQRLLRATDSTERDLLGLVVAAGGGLNGPDLAELTGCSEMEVAEYLGAVAGRTFGVRPSDLATADGQARDVYMLAHEDLQLTALRFLDGRRLDGYRDRIHNFAKRYQHQGWPSGTPEYLLRGYFRMLQATGDTARMVRCAADFARHDRMLDVTGGDVLALAEVYAAQEASLRHDPTDLVDMAMLAYHRDELTQRNARIPIELPALWVALGRPNRAEALARSIPQSNRMRDAMIAVVAALADHGDADRAQSVADTIGNEQDRSQAVASSAAALARAGQVERACEIAASQVKARHRRHILRAVVSALIEVGELDVAERVISGHLDGDVGELVRCAAAAGDVVRAIELSTAMPYAIDRIDTQIPLLGAYARAGYLTEALTIAEAVPDRYRKALALAELIEPASRLHTWRVAAAVMQSAMAVARMTQEPRQQDAFTAISIACVRIRALNVVDKLKANSPLLIEPLVDTGELERAAEIASGAHSWTDQRRRWSGPSAVFIDAAVRAGYLSAAEKFALRGQYELVTFVNTLADTDQIERAVAVAVGLDDQHRPQTAVSIAAAHSRRGDLQAAAATLEEAENAFRALAATEFRSAATGTISVAAAVADDLPRARRLDRPDSEQEWVQFIIETTEEGDERAIQAVLSTIGARFTIPKLPDKTYRQLALMIAGTAKAELVECIAAAAPRDGEWAIPWFALAVQSRDTDRAEIAARVMLNNHVSFALAPLINLLVSLDDIDRAMALVRLSTSFSDWAAAVDAVAQAGFPEKVQSLFEPGSRWESRLSLQLARAAGRGDDLDAFVRLLQSQGADEELVAEFAVTRDHPSDIEFFLERIHGFRRWPVEVAYVDALCRVGDYDRAIETESLISSAEHRVQALARLLTALHAADPRRAVVINTASVVVSTLRGYDRWANGVQSLADACCISCDYDTALKLISTSDYDKDDLRRNLALRARGNHDLPTAEAIVNSIANPTIRSTTLVQLCAGLPEPVQRRYLARAFALGPWRRPLLELARLDKAVVATIAGHFD